MGKTLLSPFVWYGGPPDGKMKSREGTVVDADDLMAEMVEEAEKQTRELGKIDDLNSDEAKQLFQMVGLRGAEILFAES